jgi:hypothetical protein
MYPRPSRFTAAVTSSEHMHGAHLQFAIARSCFSRTVRLNARWSCVHVRIVLVVCDTQHGARTTQPRAFSLRLMFRRRVTPSGRRLRQPDLRGTVFTTMTLDHDHARRNHDHAKRNQQPANRAHARGVGHGCAKNAIRRQPTRVHRCVFHRSHADARDTLRQGKVAGARDTWTPSHRDGEVGKTTSGTRGESYSDHSA